MRWIEQDLRHLMALAAGGAVAFALFILMHTLIGTPRHVMSASPPVMPIGWVTVHHETPVRRKPHIPPKPKPIKQPHTAGLVPHATHNPVTRHSMHFSPWSTSDNDLGPTLNIGPAQSQAVSGRQALSVVSRIPPLYPPRAAYRNITGTVTTCFTVRSDGSVADARIVGASSAQARRMLGQAALASILQWKFVPRETGGHAVATNNVCQDIAFTLNH